MEKENPKDKKEEKQQKAPKPYEKDPLPSTYETHQERSMELIEYGINRYCP